MNRYQKAIARVYKADYKKIKKKIMEADVISFDMYDTLVKRNVINPEDIFELVGLEFCNLTGRCIEDYKQIRCECEKIARKKTKDEEIQYMQIFENMENISQEDRTLLKKLEIQYELGMSCPNKKITELYHFALKKGKRVIITSDMYLEEKIIKKILSQNGIDGYEKLYLSSLYKKSKRTGSLYIHILNDLKIEPQKILHIGDSIRSDIIQAKSQGYKVCFIPRYHRLAYWGRYQNRSDQNRIQYSVLEAFIANNISDIKDESTARHIGFEVLGPILAGYCVWLNDEIRKNKIDKVFFLAREGKIIQQAYNILFRENKIPQSYLYVSRRSAVLPLLSFARNFDDFFNIINILVKEPELKTIRHICSFDEKEYKSKLEKIGLTEEASLYDIRNKEQFFHLVQELGCKKFEEQRKCFIKYLKQESFYGNILITDSGWSGTIQQIIQELLSDDIDLHIKGAYIGVRNVRDEDTYRNLDRNGYLFTPIKNHNFDYMTRFTNEILEKLLSCEDGSTIGYEDHGMIEVILAEKAFRDEGTIFVKEVQEEAIRFVKMFYDNQTMFEKIKIAPEVAFNAYINFAVYPSRKTVKIFSHLNSKYEMQMPMLPDKNIFYYLFHMKKLKQDLSTYCSIFLLKKIFFLPLPYYKMLFFMINRMGMKSDYRKKCEKKF